MPAAAPPHHPHPHQHPQARTHYPSSPPDALLARSAAGGNSAAAAEGGYKAIELDGISGRDSFKAPSDRSDYDYDTNSAANSPNKSRLASISPNKHLDLHLGTVTAVTAAALAAVGDGVHGVHGVHAEAERGPREPNPSSRHARHAHAQVAPSSCLHLLPARRRRSELGYGAPRVLALLFSLVPPSLPTHLVP
jgi:hypothetical protein